ncbi:MAG TPA: PAS domain-containing protein [Acidimicrobiales bacterium]|nr:PAS domain-containing protein [Acidimicrobiales bacterium]
MNAAGGSLYLDPEGAIVWADTDAAELLHRSVEELVGQSIATLLGADDPALDRLLRLLDADPPLGGCELRLWRATGGWVWVDAIVSGDRHPSFGGVRVFLAETPRSRWVEAARDLMLASTFDALVVVAPGGEIVTANRVASKLLGLSPEFFAGPVEAELGRRLRTTDGERVPWLADPVAYCVGTGRRDHRGAVVYAHPAGGSRPMVATLALRSADGEPFAVLSLIGGAALDEAASLLT